MRVGVGDGGSDEADMAEALIVDHPGLQGKLVRGIASRPDPVLLCYCFAAPQNLVEAGIVSCCNDDQTSRMKRAGSACLRFGLTK